jgi:hypothetical protein
VIRTLIRIIAFIEIIIGATAFLGLVTLPLPSLCAKHPSVFIFFLIASMVSIGIGAGLFYSKGWARMLLIFFSGYIILTKILVFANVLNFSVEIIRFIPAGLKDRVSIAYHCFLMALLTRRSVKDFFTRDESRT